MLCLSRKVGERIHIDENIVLHVVEIRGDQVRIGFEAPKHIEIHRHQVHERIQAAKRRDRYTSADRIAEGQRVLLGHHLPEPKQNGDDHVHC